METIISEHGQCLYIPAFIEKEKADHLMIQCKNELDWQQDPIVIYGQRFMIPRLHCWYGGFDYQYSKITLCKRSMPSFLQKIAHKIKKDYGYEFNGVLGNLYRDGRDSNGWHRDNEKELSAPIHIASISLGQERFFHLRRRGEGRMSKKILLEHGSLLLMTHPFQEYWEHQIPKSARVKRERINLTFRRGHT